MIDHQVSQQKPIFVINGRLESLPADGPDIQRERGEEAMAIGKRGITSLLA